MARTDSFTRTRDQLITRALRQLRAVEHGESPDPQLLLDGAEALNSIVRTLQKQGSKLWTTSSITLALVVGTAAYSLTGTETDTIDVCRFRILISNDEIPVTKVSRDEWMAIEDKTSTGDPVSVYFDETVSPQTLRFYPVPNAVRTVYYDKIRRLYKFDAKTDTADFPDHWHEALVAALSATLAPEFGKTIEERRDLRAVAKSLAREALAADRRKGDTCFVSGAYDAG